MESQPCQEHQQSNSPRSTLLESSCSEDDDSLGGDDGFSSLVRDLREVLGPSSGIDSKDTDPEVLQALMRAYTSKSSEWSKYALCEQSTNYTRNLIDQGNGKSNLVSLILFV
jgi:hypothetical protein